MIPQHAHQIFTHLTDAEKVKLHHLVISAGMNSICVEIGSYLGASANFIAAGCKDSGGRLYCIDTWLNDEMSEGKRDTFSEFMRNTAGFSDVLHVLRGWSVDVAEKFEHKVDLIFFDGGHSYETVKKDWDAWSGKLKNGATIVFHDSGWAEGVKRVIDEEVMALCQNIETLPNMWWGYLK